MSNYNDECKLIFKTRIPFLLHQGDSPGMVFSKNSAKLLMWTSWAVYSPANSSFSESVQSTIKRTVTKLMEYVCDRKSKSIFC